MLGRSVFGFSSRRYCAPIVFFALAAAASAQTRSENALSVIQKSHQQKFEEFSKQLEELEQSCRDKSLNEAAQVVASRIIPPDLESRNVKLLPKEVTPPLPGTLSPDERFWRTQLRNIENKYSHDLYPLSRKALNDGYPGYAFSLVRESALHDPDYPNARKILGFVRNQNEWVTQFANTQIEKGFVWHEKFGWLPKAHLQRFANGERFYKNKWITAEKELELRRDFSEAWEIRTDHYFIRTNVSRERGVELGLALEDFHEFFFEIFAGFFNTREQMEKRFAGNANAGAVDPKPYHVHYYRTREEYNNRLRKTFPNIEKTNGVYMTSERTAHFYDDPNNNNEATLFHEASHQLFFESHRLNRPIGDRAHFWIIEGIACYMESFQRKNGQITIGDPNYIRFAGARANLLRNKYYVPLHQFTVMGMKDFQESPDLAKNYTQSAGLARFFMEYENGRYREALVKHLTQLYSGDTRERDGAAGLDKLTGIPYTELDRQYENDIIKIEQAAANR